MRSYKATAAPPFDGKSTWHGLYYYAGHWRTVRNDAGNAIAYASAQAAIDGAKLMWTNSQPPTSPQKSD